MCAGSALNPKSLPHSHSHPLLCPGRLLAKMVDFQSPAVIEQDFEAVVKLWHVVDGIFIWEFFVTLDYELSVIRGHRPYRWTIWVYSLTRVSTLIAVVLNMLGFDSTDPINCQLWVIFELIFAYLAFASASFLIVLRIIAVWDRNKIAIAIAMSAWSTNVAFLIHGVTRLHSTWVPTQGVCAVLNPEGSKDNIIATLATDVVLLFTMLVGLLRMGQNGTTLGMFLWKQGLIWLFLATIAEVPPAVFISLNLNDPFNLMFQTPALIVMSIAATRTYRSLAEFTSPTGSFYTSQIESRRAISSDPKRFNAAPIPLDRVDPAVHRSSEDSTPANMSKFFSYGTNSADRQSHDKPVALSINNDLEDGVERV
ncbi:hypothetical protein EI94DRAFT_1750784 [Lactarius quietus]|nr:hypothetical protein EI94DRAFT_1750784 [Lactarius quietus]